jgi:hypothetical protein
VFPGLSIRVSIARRSRDSRRSVPARVIAAIDAEVARRA